VEGPPAIERVPVPVVRHGAVLPNVERGVVGLGVTTRGVNVIRGARGFGVRATDGGLRPPTPISVEPKGMPRRLTDDVDPIPVEGVADPADGAPAVPAQVPEALPEVPPPSNIVVEPTVPAVDIPVLKEVPDIEVPMPGDACGSEPPAPEQVAMPPIASPSGDAPDVSGLTPDDVSSVAPIGILVGATGEPGPTPSGDVIPSAGPGKMPIPPTCA
jgi:hypothetical protein